jgi:hypothetical protein
MRHQTVFYKFLSHYIDLTLLEKGVDYFFPVFVLVPSVSQNTCILAGGFQSLLGTITELTLRNKDWCLCKHAFRPSTTVYAEEESRCPS